MVNKIDADMKMQLCFFVEKRIYLNIITWWGTQLKQTSVEIESNFGRIKNSVF